MRELTFVKTRRVEWRSVPEPRLGGPGEALVHPVIAARCDGDNLPLFNTVTTAMRAGVVLHYLDPLVTDLLGPYPYGNSFAIGHERVAEVVECGEEVRHARTGPVAGSPFLPSERSHCERSHKTSTMRPEREQRNGSQILHRRRHASRT